MRFKVIDSNIRQIPGNPHMLCLGIIGMGLRKFWILLCTSGPGKGTYIEEYVETNVDFTKDTFGNFCFIRDDNLAFDLSRFCEEHKLTDVGSRMQELQDTGRLHLVMKE
jgi:hypothetical protein